MYRTRTLKLKLAEGFQLLFTFIPVPRGNILKYGGKKTKRELAAKAKITKQKTPVYKRLKSQILGTF